MCFFLKIENLFLQIIHRRSQLFNFGVFYYFLLRLVSVSSVTNSACMAAKLSFICFISAEHPHLSGVCDVRRARDLDMELGLPGRFEMLIISFKLDISAPSTTVIRV